MKIRNKKLLLLVLIITLCAFVSSCSNPLGEREYMADLYVDVPDTEYQLLIKEWTYMLGSGAEIYYVNSSDENIYLGDVSGGDDGFCPFKNGKYNVTYNDGSVTLSWSFDGSDNYGKSKSFVLPKN